MWKLLIVLTKNLHNHQITTCNRYWNLALGWQGHSLYSTIPCNFCNSWPKYSIVSSLGSWSLWLYLSLRHKGCIQCQKLSMWLDRKYFEMEITIVQGELELWCYNKTLRWRIWLSNELRIECFEWELQKIWGIVECKLSPWYPWAKFQYWLQVVIWWLWRFFVSTINKFYTKNTKKYSYWRSWPCEQYAYFFGFFSLFLTAQDFCVSIFMFSARKILYSV